MKNFKPSELPANTIIETEDGEYIKRPEGYWEDMFSGCGCCQASERISDEGVADYNVYAYRGHMTTGEKADDYFKDFKIVAYPVEMVIKLARDRNVILEHLVAELTKKQSNDEA